MQQSPITESIALLGFLKSANIENEFDEWIQNAPMGFAQWPEINPTKGVVKGWEYNPSDNTLEEKTYSFDDYLQKELNEQLWLAAKEIIDLKLNPTNPSTVMSDRLFNSTVLRLKNKLIERHQALSENKQLPIAKTLEKLSNFIYRQLSRQIINQRKLIEPGESFLSVTLLGSLFHWLLLKSKVDASSENAFLAFFKGNINQRSIKWHGTPQELVQLKYALFNKPDHLDRPFLTNKLKHQDFFFFFEVIKDGNRIFYDSKYNSNPKGLPFYIELLDKLDSIT